MNGRGSKSDDVGAPAIVSVSLHAALLASAIFGLPDFTKPLAKPPIEIKVIDNSEIGKDSAAPKVAPPAPQDKSLPQEPEPAPTPPMKSTDAAAAPPPPDLSKVAVAEPPKPPAPPTPNIDRRNAPVGRSDPAAKPNPQPPARGPQTASINAPRLTQSEEWAVIQKIRACWSPPLGAKDADKLAIEIEGSVGTDGRVIDARIVDQDRMRDSYYAAAANAALRATLNPRCQPWPLPSEKYETWKAFRITFDPRFV
jgi:hypothetical protein